MQGKGGGAPDRVGELVEGVLFLGAYEYVVGRGRASSLPSLSVISPLPIYPIRYRTLVAIPSLAS